MDSVTKLEVNYEFGDWVNEGREIYGECKVLTLDGAEMATTHNLRVQVDQPLKDITVYERNRKTYEKQKLYNPEICEEIKHVYGDIFDGLKDRPRCIFLDLTGSDIRDSDLKKLVKWERGFGDEYHCLFITICSRDPRGHSLSDRIERIKYKLSSRNFGLHLVHGYKRDKGKMSMCVMIFGSSPPDEPSFMPRKLTSTKDGYHRVLWWGFPKACWEPVGSDPVLDALALEK